MPFVPDTEEQLLEEKFQSMPEVDGMEPTAMEAAMAAFRTENSLGSLISRSTFSDLPDGFKDDNDFNPWDHFTEDEKLDSRFIENASMSDNARELEAVRGLTAKERKDREASSKAGMMGFAMNFGIGGIAEPVNLIPIGGAALKTYRGGHSILRSGLMVGSVSAGSTAIQEVALTATQLERTLGESATNVTAAFLLGSILGAGAQKLKDYGVTPETLKEIEDTMNVEAKIKNGDDSIGAARVADDFQVKGKFARWLAKGIGFDPLSRMVTSENPIARKFGNFLAENPYAGEAGNQTAVESLIKIHDGKYAAALQGHDIEFRAMKERLGQTKIDSLLRRGVTKKEFNEQVSRQVRDPDVNAPIEVQKSAKHWIKELYEPLKKELIDAGILDESVEVKTAINYLNRSWNKQKLAANLDGFVQKTSKWLEQKDLELFTKAKAAIEELKTAKGARKTELEAMIKKGKFKEGLDLEKQDYEDIARQIALRISGTPDGRLPYDWKLGEGSSSFKAEGTDLKGPMKSRVFNVPDKDFEEFFENDIEKLGARYLKQVAPDLELHRAFDGDLDMKSAQKDMAKYWDDKIEAEPSAKKSVKMVEKRDKELRDFIAMKDRMRGTYGQVDPMNPWVRTGRVIRDLNYLRFMGGVVASSVPDVARTFMAEGFARTMKNGLIPLMTNLKTFKVAAAAE